MLHFFLLLSGNGAEGERERGLSDWRNEEIMRECLIFSSLNQGCKPQGEWGHEATSSMNPRPFSMWIQTYGKYRFSCTVVKNPFHLLINTTNSFHIYSQIYLRDRLVFCPGTLRRYDNVECIMTCPNKLLYVAVVPKFPQNDRISSQRKKLQGTFHCIIQFWVLITRYSYTWEREYTR